MTFDSLLLINYIEETISMLMIYTSFKALSYKKNDIRCKNILLYIAFIILLGYTSEMLIESYALLKTAQVFLDIFGIWILFGTEILETVTLYMMGFTALYVIQEPIAFISNILSINTDDKTFGIIANFITLLIIIILRALLPTRHLYQRFNSEHKLLKILLINLFILVQIVDYYYKVKPDVYNASALFIVVSMLVVILLNYLVIYEEQKISQKDIELKNAEKNARLMDNMITEIRRTQHQYDNRINAMISLTKVCDSLESLKLELLKYSETLMNEDSHYDVLRLNYKIIAALIFSKINEAKESSITLNIEIYKYNLSSCMPEHILADILGIMLNNMIEATNQGSLCSLTLDSYNNRTVFKSKNEGPKLDADLQSKLFSKGYTTKASSDTNEKHGYGLYNLRKMVLEYGGSFSVYNEYSADRLKTYIVFMVEV